LEFLGIEVIFCARSSESIRFGFRFKNQEVNVIFPIGVTLHLADYWTACSSIIYVSGFARLHSDGLLIRFSNRTGHPVEIPIEMRFTRRYFIKREIAGSIG